MDGGVASRGEQVDSDPIRIDDPSTWPASAREYYARWQKDHVGCPELDQLVRERIRRADGITFAEFMDLALYHPEYGYYRSNPARMAPGGDYVTSPETHPVFGFLLTSWLRQTWLQAGRPGAWTVLEGGAGTGRLAAQILASAPLLDRDFAAALWYRIAEPSPASSLLQRQSVAEYEDRVTWMPSIDTAGEPFAGCVLANELLDAFPVHRVIRQGRALRELWVVEREGVLVEEARALSTTLLRDYFRDHGFLPRQGVPVEVNLEAPRWMGRAAGLLSRGFVLILDYGWTARELYRRRRKSGTVRSYHRHTVCSDPFRLIGEQDLTADVDFTAVIRAGEQAGLVTREYTRQCEFLARLAWQAWREQLSVPSLPGTQAARRPGAAAELVDPCELGDTRVLVQEKVG
jgi:SAM-dependent MidA family methyltransferase